MLNKAGYPKQRSTLKIYLIFCVFLLAVVGFTTLHDRMSAPANYDRADARTSDDTYAMNNTNAVAISVICSNEHAQMIRSVLIPVSTFPFHFKNSGKFERRTFLATLHCGVAKPYQVYLDHTTDAPPTTEGGVKVYNMKMGGDFRFFIHKPNIYYLCTMRLQPESDFGRICKVDIPLDAGFSPDTGLGIMMEYGIDYENRVFIPQINTAAKAYFQKLASASLGHNQAQNN